MLLFLLGFTPMLVLALLPEDLQAEGKQLTPLVLANRATTAPLDPAAKDYSGHKGVTLYVSKKGDNSNGRSWQRAFHTIQAALLAVPDDQGGHQIIVRPDTYLEANLYTNHKGAADLQPPER